MYLHPSPGGKGRRLRQEQRRLSWIVALDGSGIASDSGDVWGAVTGRSAAVPAQQRHGWRVNLDVLRRSFGDTTAANDEGTAGQDQPRSAISRRIAMMSSSLEIGSARAFQAIQLCMAATAKPRTPTTPGGKAVGSQNARSAMYRVLYALVNEDVRSRCRDSRRASAPHCGSPTLSSWWLVRRLPG